MTRHDADRHGAACGRGPSARCLLLFVFVPWLFPLGSTAAPGNEAPDPGDELLPVRATMRGDAALADLHFIDRETGWAVGDRGVIWHTRDGGATWHEQKSPVDCRLNAVFFIDDQRGWAVGGLSQTHASATRGVVLQTDDGGQTWSPIPDLLLPGLSGVKFFDAQHGIAIGDASSFQPAGVFATRDAGRTWQPLPTDAAGAWLAGDFIDLDTGAVAGPGGRFAVVRRRHVTHSPLASSSLRSMHAMRLTGPTGGWLVGDGGLVLTTRDLGHSWQSPPGELPPSVADHFDFHAIAAHGSHVWIAGAPGTRVVHSADGGQTWQALATAHNAPLRALCFIDAEHGWAAGELGAILTTDDGGRTWRVQRSGGRRAALLAVFARADDPPLELLAEQGAEEGYLTAVQMLCGSSMTATSAAGTRRDRQSREAMILAGATAADTAWRFPLPADDLALTPPDVIAALNRASDGRAVERLESHLVRALRMWRPEVVVTHHAAARDGDPLAALIEQVMMRAVDDAADPAQYVELASHAGLQPWQVKKVYGVAPAGTPSDEAINTGRFAPRLGGSLADWSAPARRLLDSDHTTPPGAHQLVLLRDLTDRSTGPRGLFRGIALTPGGEARRPAAGFSADNLDQLRRLAARRRHLRELLDRSEGNAAWAGQVVSLVDGLDTDAGAELLDQLAQGYRNHGRLDLAADTYYLLARRYRDHPLADRALVWLVQFYASSEAAQRATATRPNNVRRAAAAALGQEGSIHHADADARLPADAAPVASLSRDERLRRAVELGEYLEAARPELFAEPAVRFPLVAAQRQLGLANPAKRYFLTLGHLPQNHAWRRCADAERWLATPDELPPTKVIGTCRRAHERPHLDGVLDEPLWESADKLRLKSAGRTILSVQSSDSEGRTTDKIVRPTVRLAYDQQFLFLAIECPKAATGNYPSDDRPRPRDADLAQHDRVTIRLDVDRDYITCFELTVDHRGWTHDACWGDVNWNPTWYVAAAADATTWTIEAAIPLAELVAEPPDARHVWAVAIRRTIPRLGAESWAADPAAESSSDHFGLLIFE